MEGVEEAELRMNGSWLEAGMKRVAKFSPPGSIVSWETWEVVNNFADLG
jgi:hypothetical protein